MCKLGGLTPCKATCTFGFVVSEIMSVGRYTWWSGTPALYTHIFIRIQYIECRIQNIEYAKSNGFNV